jgi:flavin reductase (DIM6/NTAB) family NADH-FMN oxidoreductase RutF
LKAAQHTLENIKATGIYTINHIHPAILGKAHQASAKYPAGVSEFEAVGLTTFFVKNIAAPFVAESRVKFALKLKQVIPIALNDTFLIIGEVQYVHLEHDIVSQDGFLELNKANSLCSNGTDCYYKTSLVGRYEYARPEIKTIQIK